MMGINAPPAPVAAFNVPPLERSVVVRLVHSAAIIVFKQHGGAFDAEDTILALESAIAECMRCKEQISVVFLWVADGSERPCPAPLPVWANGSWLAPPPGLMQKSQVSAARLNLLMRDIDCLSQPFVGLADGPIGKTATSLFTACDLVLATATTNFDFESTNMNVDLALKVGFVGSICENHNALLGKCEELRQEFAGLQQTPMNVKLVMRQARSTVMKSFSESGLFGSRSPSVEIPATNLAEQQFAEPRKVHMGANVPPLLANFSHGLVANSKQVEKGVVYRGVVAAPSMVNNKEVENVNHNSKKVENEPAKGKASKAASKKQELQVQFSSHDGPVTTIMICNIPCRITQHELAEAVDKLGFEETYDFLYVPTYRSSAGGGSNLGYGFVNFPKPEHAAQFIKSFVDYKFEGTLSMKTCTVRPAHIQGLENNMRHFGRTTSKHRAQVPLVQPLVKTSVPDGNSDAASSISTTEPSGGSSSGSEGSEGVTNVAGKVLMPF